ncbi:septal ring lytic transglycosylase RlpA family protein [Tianweitania sp. BSSL-BM11]|uniref:Endolytic peptidoglycan transglycosylase RlpA n=1 Tax=Tianweitania aestuarii TaxID=2814886 RepID=A0ABS5RTX9_9HYPH|nr:septal ring lytic transglycosylase RlpA family protein [Tianweitania aestuarii]MBS9720397.1 septal ring lytic transglycosylase RlpA family protein [Tianweitania aestuarii]
MRVASVKAVRRVTGVVAVSMLAVLVASCASQQKTSSKKTRSKEYFAESVYGVKASPRVSNLRTKLPRGGGRDQTGKPYMVKGRWYYPKEEKGYSKTGEASWYGSAFHGRLTANGEIYDMTHLTAAHPTMPLPSYARVTNMKNGNSVIVRVNDRGPYEKGRVIDLSQKAAEMLDYAHSGMASVKVDYVGRAPLDGKDDSYLMASYRPGNGALDPSDGLPTGVMVAMNGATRSSASSSASTVAYPNGGLAAFGAVSVASVVLPDYGPMAPDRPGAFQVASTTMPVLGYAEQRSAKAAAAFSALEGKTPVAAAVANQWKQALDGLNDYVAVGTYATQEEALKRSAALSSFGKIGFEMSDAGVALTLRPDGRTAIDDMLQAAWDNGASDAFVIHD